MRYERIVGKSRRWSLEAWATRERPLCVFRLAPQVWLTPRLSVSLEACALGVGLKVSTYYWKP